MLLLPQLVLLLHSQDLISLAKSHTRACAPFFAAVPTNACEISTKLGEVSEVAGGGTEGLYFTRNSHIKLSLQTFDRNTGRKCTSGGATFFVSLVGTTIIGGYAYDNLDGTYGLEFPWLGTVEGRFSLRVVLEFDKYEGTTMCSTGFYELGNTSKIAMQRLTGASATSIYTLRSVSADGSKNKGHLYSGFWEINKTAPTSPSCQDMSYRREHVVLPVPAKYRLDWKMPIAKKFPAFRTDPKLVVDLHRGRWIHFVGKSLMRYTVSAYGQIVASAYEAVFGPETKIVDLPMPAYGELEPALKKACYGKTQSTVNFWFPEIDALITSNTHDVPQHSHFSAEKHFECMKVLFDAKGGNRTLYLPDARFNDGPDALIYNKGLHIAHGFNSAEAVQEWEREEEQVMGNFTDYLGPKGTMLLWKSTASTHFDPGELPRSWMCRTLGRLMCINSVSELALKHINVNAAKDGSGWKWHVLDMFGLALVRPDCQPDNRHNRCGNCQISLVRKLMVMLHRDLRNRTHL